MSFAGADKAQEHFELKEEVKRVGEALKISNSGTLFMERLLEAIYKNKVADVEKVKSLEGEVAALRSDISKLTAVLSHAFNFEGEIKDTTKNLGAGNYVSKLFLAVETCSKAISAHKTRHGKSPCFS